LEEEPNDIHTTATGLAQPCARGEITSNSDLDWYQIDLCSARPYVGLYLQGPNQVDFDLYLYGNPPGAPLAASEGPRAIEFLTTSLVTGTYYVLVSPVHGTGAYTLTGLLTPPTPVP
jgi:hypothetical protein